jgi:hypothetical protein
MSLNRSQNKIIIDSGASICSTGIVTAAEHTPHITDCQCRLWNNGPTNRDGCVGDLNPYMLPTIIIDKMANTTLLSVSEAYRENMCRIFTAVDCRFYTLSSILPSLKLISESGEETVRGANGLYLQESN